MADPREPRGRLVRDTWNAAVDELRAGAKPSWRKRWDDLDPADPDDAFQIEVDKRIGAAVVKPYEDLLASIWLYVRWQWITMQLTTAQKDLWADALDAFHARANAEDPDLHALPADRWWRDG